MKAKLSQKLTLLHRKIKETTPDRPRQIYNLWMMNRFTLEWLTRAGRPERQRWGCGWGWDDDDGDGDAGNGNVAGEGAKGHGWVVLGRRGHFVCGEFSLKCQIPLPDPPIQPSKHPQLTAHMTASGRWVSGAPVEMRSLAKRSSGRTHRMV